jgi:GNAT superfamily N-acetyltransferase
MNMIAPEVPTARRTHTPHIDVRLGTPDDIPQIMDLLERFFCMTIWAQHMKFNKTGALAYLNYAIPRGYAPHALAFDKEELVGLCSYHLYTAYTDKPIAVMDETFVIPKLRRSDLGRRLVSLAIDLARADGCAIMNFPIASGLPAQNSLMNMIGHHFDGEAVGMIFRKVL